MSKSTRVVLMGKSRQKVSNVKEMLDSIEPSNLPKDILSDIYIILESKEKYRLNLTSFNDNITYDDLKTHVSDLRLNTNISRVEVIVDLDEVQRIVKLKANAFLNMYFDE